MATSMRPLSNRPRSPLSSQDIEGRLEELETRLVFQDQELQALNDVIIRQQKQIDRLVEQVSVLKDKLQDMAPSLVVAQSEETPPPHY